MRKASDLQRLVRLVELMRRRDELAMTMERRRSADALEAIARLYASSDGDWRETALHFSLYRDRLAGLSARRHEADGKASRLSAAVRQADGRLKALASAYAAAAGAETRRHDERELAERIARAAITASDKPRDR